MQGVYGTSKIDVSPTVTDAAVQYLRDSDLGITFNTQHNSSDVAKIPTPPAGTTGTVDTVVGGSGYTLGENKILVQTATDGTGTGLRIKTSIIENTGILAIGSEAQLTAGFNTYQNTLLENLNIAATQYTYARITATGQPFSGVSLAAMPGVSATGTAGTFIVTVNSGVVTKIVVGNLGGLGGGSGYKVGDVVTIDKATLELNGSFGGGIVFQGDLQFLVTEDNIFGGIAQEGQIQILTPGKGHAVGDVITFKEEGTDNVGTGSVAIATLQTLGGTVISATPQNKIYPAAVRNTGTAAGTIAILDLAGNISTLGNVQPGQLIPISFSQIEDSGTGLTVGLVEILYK